MPENQTFTDKALAWANDNLAVVIPVLTFFMGMILGKLL
jgi:hypothetical protein